MLGFLQVVNERYHRVILQSFRFKPNAAATIRDDADNMLSSAEISHY